MTIMPDTRSAAIDLGDLPRQLDYALRRAQLVLAQDLSAALEPVGLRPLQVAVLSVLRGNPGLRQSEIGAALGIRPANLVPLIDELERRTLAERRPIPADRRANGLFITPAGSAAHAKARACIDAHEVRFAARLRAGGKDQLLNLLGRLANPA